MFSFLNWLIYSLSYIKSRLINYSDHCCQNASNYPRARSSPKIIKLESKLHEYARDLKLTNYI